MALPALGPIILGVIIAAAFRILLGLGIGFVAFTFSMPAIMTWLASYFSELPPEILQMVGILRVDQCFTLIFSAAAARLAYKISAAPLVSLGGE